MKYKTDDVVWYDDNLGLVITGWPSGEGYTYQVYWVEAHTRSEVRESDLIPHDEYNVG